MQVHMLPLSFAEYIEYYGDNEIEKKYNSYVKNGGFPYLLNLDNDSELIHNYLEGVYNTVLLKDVVSRNNIKDIIIALKKMTNKEEYYNGYGGCIWDWRDFKRIQKRNIRALRRLYRIMGKHELSVYFYDSY